MRQPLRPCARVCLTQRSTGRIWALALALALVASTLGREQ